MAGPEALGGEAYLDAKPWHALTAIYFSAFSIALFDLELKMGIKSARGLAFSLVVVAELLMVLMSSACSDRA